MRLVRIIEKIADPNYYKKVFLDSSAGRKRLEKTASTNQKKKRTTNKPRLEEMKMLYQ